MGEKNDYIQLPPMKKDTSADVVSFIWEYMKLPEEVREKVKSEMDEIREHCRDSDFQRPNLYDIASAEEVAGLEKIITESKEIVATNLVFLFIKTLRNFIYDTKNRQDQGRKVVLIFCSE